MNDWKIVKDEPPPLNTRILVFRWKAKKYTIVRVLRIPDHMPSLFSSRMVYHQEYGITLAMDENDLWFLFPPAISTPIIKPKKRGRKRQN